MWGTRFWVISSLVIAFIAGLTTSILHYRYQQESSSKQFVVKTWHYPDTFAKQLRGNQQAGEMVYQAYCVSCHGSHPDIPVHAPRVDQPELWRALSTVGKKTLLQNTLRGIRAMPARGGCFECDDQSIEQAIDYMLKQALGAK